MDNARVNVFTLEGEYVSAFGKGYFTDPQGITVDNNDNVYVSDNATGYIYKFSSDGNYLLKFGGTPERYNRNMTYVDAKAMGKPDGKFNSVESMAVMGDKIYVADENNRGEGIGEGLFFDQCEGICFDDSGNLFAVNESKVSFAQLNNIEFGGQLRLRGVGEENFALDTNGAPKMLNEYDFRQRSRLHAIYRKDSFVGYFEIENNSRWGSASGTFLGVSAIGTGLPTTTGQTTTSLPGFPTTGTHSTYAFSMSPAGDIIYACDDGSNANGGGVQKWTLSGGTWTLSYVLNSGITGACRGIAVNYTVPLAPVIVARYGQTTIYSDDFNRATLAGGTYTYTTTATGGGTSGASIVSSTTLQLTNGTGAANGRVSTGVTLTNGSGYNTILDNCSGLVTWTFNMRYGRTGNTPSGFTAGNYGVGFVLAADNVNFAASGSKGYAVIFGNTGSPDNFNLVAYNNGIVADINTSGTTAPAALVLGSGSFAVSTQAASNDFYSFKVTYNPTTHVWTFFGRDDGASAFADPAAGSFTTIGTFTETAAIFRTTALANIGGIWNHSTGANNLSTFDNFKLTVTGSNPSIAISSAHPSAGNINVNSTDNIVGSFQLDVTTATATLTGMTVTTAGTYVTGDIATNGFKFWINSSNNLTGATQLGTSQAAAGPGNVVVSGLSQSISSGTTRYILFTTSISSGATAGHTINISSTAFSNITFSSGTKTGTDPVVASNNQTIVALTPSIVISDGSPAAGNIIQNSTNNILRSIQLDVTVTSATLTGVTVTTAGTYQTSDLQANGFKFWINSTNNLTGATQLGTNQAIVASGNNVSVTGLSQNISSGTTRYILVTVDVAYNANTSRNISITSTAFSNITFSTGSKTGTDPVAAGNTQTFAAVTPSIAIAQVGPSAGNLSSGTTSAILYQLSLAVTSNSTDLNSVVVTTGGTYQAADLTAASFKLWYNTSNTFGTASQIGTSQAIVATGNTVTFGSLTQNVVTGTTGYIWVTVDVSGSATAGRTINITSTAFSNITFSAGTKTGTNPSAAGGTQTFTATPSMTEVLFPQYAVNGTTTGDRIPAVCRLTLNNLNTNATYRYTVAASTDGGITTSNGAGNMFAIYNTSNADGYIRGYTSGKSLNGTEFSGNEFTTNNRYATFTTDGSGSYTGWFSMIPTGNAVFNAGNNVYFYVQINDGASGTSIAQSLRSTNTITILSSATGTSVKGPASNVTGENMVFLYDNTAGSGRPLYGTWTESDGITETFSTWYTGNVDGTSSAWGAVIPSSNANGMKRVEFRSPDSNSLKYALTDADGVWNGVSTVNPTAGYSTPLSISNTTCDNINISGNVTMSSNLTVSGILTLSNGTIDMGANTLEIGTSTSNVGSISRTGGSIKGIIKRWFNTSTTTNSIFPLDDGSSNYVEASVSFTGAPATGGSLTAVFHTTGSGTLPSQGDGNYIPAPELHVNFVNLAPQYWTITAGDGLAGYTYDIKLLDNETSEDLLGFKVHANLLIDVINDDSILPITIGVFGEWGSGKSSILKMVYDELIEKSEDALILYFNGWVFEGYDDAKAALLESIIKGFEENEKIREKVKGEVKKLLKSVDWMRVVGFGFKNIVLPTASAMLTGGVSIIPQLAAGLTSLGSKDVLEKIGSGQTEELLSSFLKDKEIEEDAMLVRNFRDDFSKLIEKSKAFDKITAKFKSFRESNRYSVFGLTDTKDILSEEEYELASKSLLHIPEMSSLISQSLYGNPRQIKRFLNTFTLRKRLAKVANIKDFDEMILAKLMILEYSEPNLFTKIYEWQSTQKGIAKEIKDIEQNIDGKSETDIKNYLETYYKDWSAEKIIKWFQVEPKLINIDLSDYYWITRDKISSSIAGASLIPPIIKSIFAELEIDEISESIMKGIIKEKVTKLNELELAKFLDYAGSKLKAHGSDKKYFEIFHCMIDEAVPKCSLIYRDLLSILDLKEMPPSVGRNKFMGTSASYHPSLKGKPQWGNFSGTMTSACNGQPLSNERIRNIFQGYNKIIGGVSNASKGRSSVMGRAGLKSAVNIGNFLSSLVNSNFDLTKSLQDIGITDLAGKSLGDIINNLIEYCSGPSTSLDDKAAKQATRLLLEELVDKATSIEELEERLKQTVTEDSLDEIIIKYFGNYVNEHISVMFWEKLTKEKGDANRGKLFKSIKDYINERLKSINKKTPLKNINWNSDVAKNLISTILNNVLTVFV
ncbi:unnamed protein product [Rotaria sp. Silwood1]|nr:unnamed protein product [Rotaria sp. Silwood1]CAF4598461.1 unnamed protein product [Rotaria sp. Silwood1]